MHGPADALLPVVRPSCYVAAVLDGARVRMGPPATRVDEAAFIDNDVPPASVRPRQEERSDRAA